MINNRLSDEFFKEIARKATTLHERIADLQQFVFVPAAEGLQQERLRAWREVYITDDPSIFDLRLQNDGISDDRLTLLLGEVAFKNEEQLPEWITLFRELMESLMRSKSVDLSHEMANLFGEGMDHNVPYLHLLTPIVRFATGKLSQLTGPQVEGLFTPEARHQLNKQLALVLLTHSGQTFQLEFQVFKAGIQSAFSRLFEQASDDVLTEDSLYQQFISQTEADFWQRLFSEYSSLARIITTITKNWIHNSEEFINRLSLDSQEITAHFFHSKAPGRIVSYKGGVSDSHDHGKSVIILTFESEKKLVYKPKNCEMERVWSAFIDWFNQKGLQPVLQSLDVLNKNNYGWVGFIEFAECTSRQEVTDYYRRIGALIGMVYLLKGNDFHQENLIASGAFPIVVDLESVMHHEGSRQLGDFTASACHLVNTRFSNSVLRTGFLPAWIPGKDGFLFDVSGIGGVGYSESPYQRVQWMHINTDLMQTTLVPVSDGGDDNLPVLNGRRELPTPYTDDIVTGFTCFYRMVIRHKEEVPVHLFKGQELRFIFRSTRIYGLIGKTMMNPKYMRSGFDRSLKLELLGKAFVSDETVNLYWPVFKSEVRQMTENDIPIFWANSDQSILKDNRGIVNTSMIQSIVYDDVRERLRDFDETDMAIQCRFIRASLVFKEAGHSDWSVSTNMKPADPVQEAIPVSSEQLTETALEIGQALKKEAIFSGDGTCTWITASRIHGTDRFRMEPMSLSLYDGIAGVALFLAALRSITHDAEITALSTATLSSLRQELSYIQNLGRLPMTSTIGVTSGLPSVIYTLLKISTLLNDPFCLEDAINLEKAVTPRMIRSDRSFDIMTGSAGCIIAMLALHKQADSNAALGKAILCGDHLLNNITHNADGTVGWETHEGIMLTGFSHGQAGIAAALIKLYKVTLDEQYRQAAEGAIRYEDSLFSERDQNWPDLRKENYKEREEPGFMKSWCHGAPGIGLARILIDDVVDSPENRKDVMAAMHTTLETPVHWRDHLCCGNMGRIDILLCNALKNGDAELMKRVQQQAGVVFERAMKQGHFNLFSDAINDFFNPGFFMGMSGVGYELLRLAFPEKIPSILAFE